MGTKPAVYDRWYVWPFVSAALLVVVNAVIAALVRADVLAVVLLGVLPFALMAYSAPVHIQIDADRLRVRYALRHVDVPRASAVVTKLGPTWWRRDRKGWFVIDRRSSWHRYPFSQRGSLEAPIGALQEAGYTIRVGEPADWGRSLPRSPDSTSRVQMSSKTFLRRFGLAG